MKIKMQLLSDAIFGNGMSVPGGEDISVLQDPQGFPYYKGATLKGIFREELNRYLHWTMQEESQIAAKEEELLGNKDQDEICGSKLVFSDFILSGYVREKVLEEIGDEKEMVLDALTNLRAFTKIEEDGAALKGSLRSVRCINKGLYFYSEIACVKEDEALVKEVLALIKWVGAMRNRGFGKVKIEAVDGGEGDV